MMFRLTTPLAVFALLASTAQAVTIEIVPVGNPGNANDPETGYGSVADPYRIGKYEVTARQYTEFLNAVAGVDTYELYDMRMWGTNTGCKIQRSGSSPNFTYSVAADRANRPVNWVSWGDAARFANWLHNGQPTTGVQDLTTTEDGAYFLNGATGYALMAVVREEDAIWFLPTEDEWYKAAYHKNDGVTGNYWDYPTKADDPSVPSNDLINPDPGNNANFFILPSDSTIGSPYWTTEVGEFENSESPYHTFDQGGNLWEWNETAVNSDDRGLRGSYWGNYSQWLHASRSSKAGMSYENDLAGFRVASVPEPSTLTLLVYGVVGLLAYGWRTRKRT